jgi:plastocyanin
MRLNRRQILVAGGGLAAAHCLPCGAARAGEQIEVTMQGRNDGSHVWFDPTGILIQPGQTIRWTNIDQGNSHTTTAYSPANFGRPLRMPREAKSWNSDYLLPGETFSVTFIEKGVYDYYCIPHEKAGMVGRIVVGAVEAHRFVELTETNGALPPGVVKAFPSVHEIMTKGVVRRGKVPR